jgi:hypothetical protein
MQENCFPNLRPTREEEFFMVLKKLRVRIVQRYDTQIAAARELGFNEARLSKIIHGHIDPTPAERVKLVAAFGAAALKATPVRAARPATESEARDG